MFPTSTAGEGEVGSGCSSSSLVDMHNVNDNGIWTCGQDVVVADRGRRRVDHVGETLFDPPC